MSIRNSEPNGTVPNGSKPGRPPIMTDEELDACVAELAAVNRRLPSLDEIIAASGGCQRARAVAARKRQAHAVAESVVTDHLAIPDHIHQRHLVLLREWVRLARESVAPWVQSAIDAGLGTQTNLEARIEEQSRLIASLEAELDSCRHERDALSESLIQCQSQLREAELVACRWQAIAETRRAADDGVKLAN